MTDPCYRKPFLKEVIARLDFASPIDEFTDRIPDSIANIALARFPVSEPKQAFSQEVEISDSGVKHSKTPFTEWNYYGRDREKRLTISREVVFVTYTAYTTYENMCKDLITVVSAIRDDRPTMKGRRLGLRYINNIDLPKKTNPFEWDDVLQPHLLGVLKHFQSVGPLTRVFHIVDFRFDDVNVKYQFGLANPDHPAIIRRPVFVLDLDASVTGLIEPSDLPNTLDRCHQHVQGLFEQSITNELRVLMNDAE